MVQASGWALPSLAAAIIALGMLPMVARHAAVPGRRGLLALLAGLLGWSLGGVGTHVLADPAAATVALQVAFAGSTLVPLGWVAFVLRYTGAFARLAGPRFGLLVVPAVLAVAAAWSDGLHHGFWSDLHVVSDGGRSALVGGTGPLQAAWLAYGYALLALGLVVLVSHLAQSPWHREKLAAVAVAPLVVIAADFARYLPANVWPLLDTGPFGIALAALLYIPVLQKRLLEVAPIARYRVVEDIPDAIFVLDSRGAVVDLNPTAAILAHRPRADCVRVPLAELLPAATQAIPLAVEAPVDLVDGARSFRITGSLIRDTRATVLGSVLVFHDTSEFWRTEQELRHTQEALERANQDLIELANTDPLTRIYNRRALMLALSREVARARRYGRPITVMAFDLDHFKKVNDTWGHAAGDRVLIEVARIVSDVKRAGDFAGRIGGEEFALVLPDTDLVGAHVVGERLRAAIEEAVIVDRGNTLRVTVSVGIAMMRASDTPEELLARADRGLYEAKGAGRNRVCVGIN